MLLNQIPRLFRNGGQGQADAPPSEGADKPRDRRCRRRRS